MSGRTLRAPAKINLALAVDRPRPDGMHPIATWMTAIDLCDEVTITPTDEAASEPLRVEWAADAVMPTPIEWPAESDLTLRAVRAIEERAGEPLHAAIRLTKRIPTGAGLGGGSADAAAALRLMNELYELDLSIEELRAIGRGLGSDVPFFLDESDPPRPALVTGLGESIERLAPVDLHLALIVPDFGCPTGAVYHAFDGLDPGPFRDEAVAELARSGAVEVEALFNDLAEAAERVEFVLGSIRSRAEQIAGAPVHVTGSGSAMFVVCENEADARARAAAIEAELSGCAVAAVRTLS